MRNRAQRIPASARVKPIAKAKAKLAQPPPKLHENSRAWLGIDLSLHALAIAGLGYDDVLKKHVGPCFVVRNWNKHDDYFDRLYELSTVQNFISNLLWEMKLFIDLDKIFIAQEEPWPLGLVGKGHSQTLKQQAELSGALLAGLLRYGYRNIFQIHHSSWKKIVADDLGITTHFSSWGKGIQGKMRPKEWALAQFNNFNPVFGLVPEWPDLLADAKNGGRKPQPENSRATPLQPDDRYQALPMALFMMREEQSSIKFSTGT